MSFWFQETKLIMRNIPQITIDKDRYLEVIAHIIAEMSVNHNGSIESE